MNALVVYDSVFGNTEKIARAIGQGIGAEARVLRTIDAQASGVRGVDLLVVGGPTYAGNPRPELKAFLDSIPPGALDGVKVAAFDTRVGAFFAKIFGYAAPKIAKALEGKGGALVAPGEPFIVQGKEGPLKEGEEARATAWGKGLVG